MVAVQGLLKYCGEWIYKVSVILLTSDEGDETIDHGNNILIYSETSPLVERLSLSLRFSLKLNTDHLKHIITLILYTPVGNL